VAPSVQRRKVWLTPTAGVPCSNAAKTRNPLKFAGVPQSRQQFSAVIGPKFTILREHVEEILLFNNFFPIVDMCLSCGDIARQSCAMVPRWRFFASCIYSEPRAAHFRHAFRVTWFTVVVDYSWLMLSETQLMIIAVVVRNIQVLLIHSWSLASVAVSFDFLWLTVSRFRWPWMTLTNRLSRWRMWTTSRVLVQVKVDSPLWRFAVSWSFDLIVVDVWLSLL